jgi:DNA-binding NtrC family response regulator
LNHNIAASPENLSRGRVLVVDDEKNIRTSVQMTLKGYHVALAASGHEAEKLFSEVIPDVVLLDVRLPGRSGLDLMNTWSHQFPQMPIILMSGEASLEEALQGMKIGAYDFIEKPLGRERLLGAVERAVETVRLRSMVRQDLGDGDKIIGSSATIQAVLAKITKLADTRTRVLITGESGTGKDLLARMCHKLSSRANKLFCKVNCAAIPHDLIESELFGHSRGAFTGAVTARKGLFETASGGTLFLDEIGELSLPAQAKLLRVLQNGEFTPVGTSAVIHTDVRVIAATNRNLQDMVLRGLFREDLYYRIAVVTVESPALRERREDIRPLAWHFIEQVCRENGMGIRSASEDVWSVLESYHWPGNIRELRNIIERAVILSSQTISLQDLPLEISSLKPRQGAYVYQEFQVQPWQQFKDDSERSYLQRVLESTGGNVSEAARLLQVERTTIYKWIKALGMKIF